MRKKSKKDNKIYYIAATIVIVVTIALVSLIIKNSSNNVEPYSEPNNSTSTNENEPNPNDTIIKNEYGVVFYEVNETVYTTIYLNIRNKPSLDSDVIFQANVNQKFTRIGIGDNGWDKLKLDDGSFAYASSEYLTTKKASNNTNGEDIHISSSHGLSVSNTPVNTTHYTGNTLKSGVTESQADTFFNNAVFYGDSVTLGFQNYISKQEKGFLGGLIVYGTGSYGIGNALKPISDSSIHPTYKGYQTQLWDLTAALKADKVFMMFGMNDLGLYGVEDSVINYKTLIDKIREVNPNVEIYILTTTPMTKNYQLTYLNNSNIRLFNNKLMENATSWNVEIIDVASYLMDNDGYLISKYASDGKYHLTESAYVEWIKVLRSFASNKI